MDQAPIDFQRIKAACEQLQAGALECAEDPVDKLAKKAKFAAKTRAITLLLLAVQLRDHLAEAGMVASGLRVGVRVNKQNQDYITCPWQICLDGQWGPVPEHALAQQALEGINYLLTPRKPMNKRNSQARNTGTRGLGLIEQTIMSMTMLNIQGIGTQSWRTLYLTPAVLNKLVRHIAGPEVMALSQNLALEANTPTVAGHRSGPRL